MVDRLLVFTPLQKKKIDMIAEKMRLTGKNDPSEIGTEHGAGLSTTERSACQPNLSFGATKQPP